MLKALPYTQLNTQTSTTVKIAFVCNEYPEARRGGQGVVIHDLARDLVAAGHHVRVIGIYDRPPYPADGYDTDGVFHRSLRKSTYPLAWIAARRQLYCALRNWAGGGEIDLIEAPLSRGLIAGFPALPVPVVVRVHGSSVCRSQAMGTPPPRWHRGLERRALARADACVSVSQFMADRVRAEFAYSRPISIIPNPVDVSPRQWQGADSQDIVFAGNRDRLKGLPELLLAWPTVRERFPEAELHLYGRRQGDCKLDGVVAHGHCPREEVLGHLSRARAAIFPSRFEAFGLVAAEAMACGCPTIAGRQGGGAEIGQTERDLLVTDCEPHAIASKICRLLGDPLLSSRLSTRGQQAVEAFTLDALRTRNCEFWESAVAEFS
jgi:glycosyltransferase involved in cell wall biosynthesis